MFEKIKECILKPDTDEELEKSSRRFVYLGLFMLIITLFALIFDLHPVASKELPINGAWFFAGASAILVVALRAKMVISERRISRLEARILDFKYEQPNPNLRHD